MWQPVITRLRQQGRHGTSILVITVLNMSRTCSMLGHLLLVTALHVIGRSSSVPHTSSSSFLPSRPGTVRWPGSSGPPPLLVTLQWSHLELSDSAPDFGCFRPVSLTFRLSIFCFSNFRLVFGVTLKYFYAALCEHKRGSAFLLPGGLQSAALTCGPGDVPVLCPAAAHAISCADLCPGYYTNIVQYSTVQYSTVQYSC